MRRHKFLSIDGDGRKPPCRQRTRFGATTTPEAATLGVRQPDPRGKLRKPTAYDQDPFGARTRKNMIVAKASRPNPVMEAGSGTVETW